MTEEKSIEAGATIHVDGAQGEGGGQVLRSSLATHIDVLRQFLGVRIEVAPEPDGRTCLVRVSPPL
jgi:RNA 3'-terminal phosphate cyclase